MERGIIGNAGNAGNVGNTGIIGNAGGCGNPLNAETTRRVIAFSPPDITEEDIAEVAQALRSGWITTGPRTKLFEERLAHYADAQKVACLGSATAALECALRALGVGPGDEVITSAYTYTASCSVICHVGAIPILCDTAPGSYEMDYAALEGLVTERTRAVIPVDIAGRMCDYDRIFAALDRKKELWKPTNGFQAHFDRVIVLADAAHSFGARYQGLHCGSVADFTAFSFHAVKNLTTGEGGALAWRKGSFAREADSEAFYRQVMLCSLHGQTKDALAKSQGASWEYDIAFPGWKCNMTDIQAALGLSQLNHYQEALERRQAIVLRYEEGLAGLDVSTLAHAGEGFLSSGHLMLVRLNGKDEAFRNAVIGLLAERGVASNVHYKPLPLLSAYQGLGFAMDDFPHAYAQYRNEISLPLHTLLSDEDVDYVVASLRQAITQLESDGLPLCEAQPPQDMP
ncbi:MAG: DegT/DnrJ/EryC1/StrS family aminotransferase [Coriobacteriaceae bacterium]|jgi:dTDP-4-amino-4,6-dideoxygalactose transaminase|nr:DegT/DnrJ/EryC1/StrS family aminotransferase [Coriobacteriaceae bacterium]